MHSYIAIEGPIGVGKTTLTRALEEHMSAAIILDAPANPFLEDFYKDRPGAAFKTQMYFLISRFRQQIDIEKSLENSTHLVCDYLFAKDKIFAYLTLEDEEIVIYDKYFAALSGYVRRPDWTVYLKAPRDVLLERVRRRNVEFEAKISDAYMDEVIEAYDHYFYHYKETPLLIVDTAEIDFVEDREELTALMQRICAGNIQGVQYFHPVRRRRK